MKKIWISFLALCVSSICQAAEDPLDWLYTEPPANYFSLEFSADDEDANSYAVSFEHAFNSATRLFFSAGASRSKLLRKSLKSNDFLFGILRNQGENWQFGLRMNASGSSNELEIRGLTASFGYFQDDWSIGLSPSRREIDVFGNDLKKREISRNLSSNGIEITTDYYALTMINFSLSYAGYQYSEDLTRLKLQRHPILLRILSPATLSLAGGLNDYRYAIGIGIPINAAELGLNYEHSVAAIDELSTDLYSGSIFFPLTKMVTGLVEMGSLRDDFSNNTVFFTLGVGFSW